MLREEGVMAWRTTNTYANTASMLFYTNVSFCTVKKTQLDGPTHQNNKVCDTKCILLSVNIRDKQFSKLATM